MATRTRTRRARAPTPDPVKHLYNPYLWQIAFWRDRSKILLATGSAGGGKSRGALEKVNGYLLKYPGATGLMLRKAREYASKSLVPMMRRTVTGNDPRIRMLKSETLFEYPNGSVLYWGGMKNDEQREALRSIGGDGSLDIILVEEATAFTEDDFNELLARLRGKAAPWRQIILCTNPDAPTHWIYQRLILGGQASVYYSRAADNPANPPDYLETLDGLTGVLGLRLRDGKWVQAQGAVYADFDPDVHAVEFFTPPPTWRRIRSIDFGFVNPFVCQWWAVDGDERMYLYRELYVTHTLVEDLAHQINALTAGMDLDDWKALTRDEQRQRLAKGEPIEATVADHDAEDRATLAKYGIVTIPARKDISLGIQAVQRRLRVQADGKPRLAVMRGALVEEDDRLGAKPKSTLAEFPGYVWRKPREGEQAKEEPVDQNNHGMDATRYAAMYLEQPYDWGANA